MIWPAALALALAAGAPQGVPFVGCAADGQVGPVPAPPVGRVPRLPAGQAARLAYYVSPHLAVLAPRGWHCFEVYGSNGETLLVTPGRHDLRDRREAQVLGFAVEMGLGYGGTSGRWDVAEMISRYFPRYRHFVSQVSREAREVGGIVPPFPARGYPADLVLSRTATEIRLTTPARLRGVGTAWLLAPADRPVESLVLLMPNRDMNLVVVRTRLPRAAAGLGPAILDHARNGLRR